MPNLSPQEFEGIKSEISQLIKKIGGKVEKVEEFGKRKLSYAIKQNRYGFYLDYILTLPFEVIDKLKNELKLKSKILRFELSNSAKISQKSFDRYQRVRSWQKSCQDVNVPHLADKDKTIQKEMKENEKDQSQKEKPRITLEELDKKLEDVLKIENI